MSKRKQTKDEDRPKQLEKTQKYLSLAFQNVPEGVSLPDILQQIRGVDVCSAERHGQVVVVSFFSYFDAFKAYKATREGVSVAKHTFTPELIKTSINDEEREKLYLSNGAGGTRNVMLGNLEDYMTADFLKEEAEKYGSIETFKHFKERRLAYVEFFSYISAIKFVSTIREDSLFQSVKASFGKDKCGPPEGEESSLHNSRTVYLGNLTTDTTASDIFTVLQGGKIFSVKMIKEKKCAFVSFFDYVAAAAFIEYANTFPIMLQGMHLKVGPGKIQPLPASAPVLAWTGATRLLSIGLDRSVSEGQLLDELEKHGEIEKTVYTKDESSVIVGYTTVIDAYSAHMAFATDPLLSGCLNGYAEDPCASTTTLSLIMQVQKRTGSG
ncbi:hypothetical protein NEDG_00890 [Nematocida displodere]|uniref:RRM domain-containing protein n=1 Tax=Nematocida displodere TaxID=1805483 RepID=A0A177ECU6_9MICR|nr:hypothetical protein NEDG_00890 [Nematocida displodere]